MTSPVPTRQKDVHMESNIGNHFFSLQAAKFLVVRNSFITFPKYFSKEVASEALYFYWFNDVYYEDISHCKSFHDQSLLSRNPLRCLLDTKTKTNLRLNRRERNIKVENY